MKVLTGKRPVSAAHTHAHTHENHGNRLMMEEMVGTLKMKDKLQKKVQI